MRFRSSLSLGLLLLLIPLMVAKADVIIPGTYPVNTCTKITNFDSFPDVYLLASHRTISKDARSTIRLRGEDCLPSTGYKLNFFLLFASSKSYADRLGIENLEPPPLEDYPIQYGKNTLHTSGIRISDEYSYESETGEYTILGFDGKELVLYLSRITYEFDDERPPIVRDFPPPVIPGLTRTIDYPEQTLPVRLDISTVELPPEETKRHQPWWVKLWCFIKGLFGGSCSPVR